jgi:hypothetical protein
MSDSTTVATVPVGAIVSAPEASVPATEPTGTAIYARFQSDITLKKADTNDERGFSVVASAEINAPVSGLRFELTKPAQLFSLKEFITFLHDQLELDVSDQNFDKLPDYQNLLGLNFTINQFLIDTHKDAKPHFDFGAELGNAEKPWNPIGKLQMVRVGLRISDQPIPKPEG